MRVCGRSTILEWLGYVGCSRGVWARIGPRCATCNHARVSEVNVHLDPRSPEGREARAAAFELIAAQQGGSKTYFEIFNERFGGPRLQRPEDTAYLLRVIDALASIAHAVAYVATMDTSDQEKSVQDTHKDMLKSPEELLASVDSFLENMAKEPPT